MKRTLHFHQPECLAWTLNQWLIRVGPRREPAPDETRVDAEGNLLREVGDIAGWTGVSPDRVFGCDSCGSRTGVHKMGCAIHR